MEDDGGGDEKADRHGVGDVPVAVHIDDVGSRPATGPHGTEHPGGRGDRVPTTGECPRVCAIVAVNRAHSGAKSPAVT